ncbi:MAG: tetratricopeptide repeat protein [Candidatus Magnetobacterium sp. LHC-1]|uniref:Tetratricopeptide repeat protein n=1 Tax=Candidatus Magnetobacterium casense TaxID=1455061 RepID=A0ABS6S296_9BACT|nr:tetratricopeptide repeat protein [Candidatus Magnetobacterium casensis]MBF0608905.1 tetratricopeptide repeat protein [Nitrospirota bacterium]MBV6342730.1 tetratricopeptide repeat protein [Candidatus Magnetobacterium casensis]
MYLRIVCTLIFLIVSFSGYPWDGNTHSGSVYAEDSVTFYNRGLELHKNGDYDMAIAAFTKAIEIIPRYAEAYTARGTAWRKKKDYDRAIADYNRSVEINPRYSLAYYGLWLAWNKKGDPDKAIAALKQGAQIGDTYAQEILKTKGITW